MKKILAVGRVDYSIAWENHKKLDLSFAGVQIGNATYNPSEKWLSANKLNFLSSFRHKNTNLDFPHQVKYCFLMQRKSQ